MNTRTFPPNPIHFERDHCSKGWTNKAKQTRCEARDLQYYVCTQCTVHYTYTYVCIIFFDNIQASRLTIQFSYGPLTAKSKFDDAPTNDSDFPTDQ